MFGKLVLNNTVYCVNFDMDQKYKSMPKPHENFAIPEA